MSFIVFFLFALHITKEDVLPYSLLRIAADKHTCNFIFTSLCETVAQTAGNMFFF